MPIVRWFRGTNLSADQSGKRCLYEGTSGSALSAHDNCRCGALALATSLLVRDVTWTYFLAGQRDRSSPQQPLRSLSGLRGLHGTDFMAAASSDGDARPARFCERTPRHLYAGENAWMSRFDDELKTTVRRNKLLGMWAAEKLGLGCEQAQDYSQNLAMGTLDPEQSDVFRKIRQDFEVAGVVQSDEEILRVMSELMLKASSQMPRKRGDAVDGAALMLARKLSS